MSDADFGREQVDVPAIPLRPLGFGEVIDGAVQLYRRDFRLFFFVALAGALPGYAIGLAVGTPPAGIDASGQPDFAALWPPLLTMLPTLATWWLGTLALAVAASARIRGRPMSFEQAWRGILRPFPAAAGAYILAFFFAGAAAVAAMFAVSAVSAALILAGDANWFTISMTVVLAGTAAILVVSLWYALTFGIFPAVLQEGASATRAVGRSLRLTRGAWFRVLFIMLVVLIIRNVPPFAVAATVGGGLNAFASPELLDTSGPVRDAVSATVNLLLGALLTPLLVTTVFVLHHDRRVRTEAADLEMTAERLGTS